MLQNHRVYKVIKAKSTTEFKTLTAKNLAFPFLFENLRAKQTVEFHCFSSMHSCKVLPFVKGGKKVCYSLFISVEPFKIFSVLCFFSSFLKRHSRMIIMYSDTWNNWNMLEKCEATLHAKLSQIQLFRNFLCYAYLLFCFFILIQ